MGVNVGVNVDDEKMEKQKSCSFIGQDEDTTQQVRMSVADELIEG